MIKMSTVYIGDEFCFYSFLRSCESWKIMKHRKCAFMLTKKKNVQLEGFILKQLNFIWGKTRTAAQEDSTSDSSERLLQRGNRGRSVYKSLVRGMFNAIRCLLYKRFCASYRS